MLFNGELPLKKAGNGRNNGTGRPENVSAHLLSQFALLSAVCDGVIVCSCGGEVLYFNRTAARLTGWEGDVIGRSLSDHLALVSHHNRRPIPCPFGSEIRPGSLVSVDNCLLVHRDGSTRTPVECSGQCATDGLPEVFVVVTIRDLTEQRRAERRVRESDLRFQLLMQRIPAAAYTCDADGLITSFNKRATDTWGREPRLNSDVDRWCGSMKLYLSDGTPITHDKCWMARALKEDKFFEAEEIIVERPDGSRRHVLAHASPYYDETGEIAGAFNVLFDITARKQAELHLQEEHHNKEELIRVLLNEILPPLAELREVIDALSTNERGVGAIKIANSGKASIRAIEGALNKLVADPPSASRIYG